jgi:hypothetical protein
MTSYEVIRAAIEGTGPDRLPLIFGTLGISDVHWVGWGPSEGWQPAAPNADEWGCIWQKSEMKNMGQVKGHPLEDLSAMDRFPWPKADIASRFRDTPNHLAQAGDKYVVAGIFMVLWERIHTLHGFERTLEDLHLNRSGIEELADRILDYHIGIIDQLAARFPGRIHGISMTDDQGSQQGMFISPRMWREVFLPRYRRLFDAIHRHGMHAWIHSCGKVNDVVELYIEAGLDSVNLQQPRALGIEEMGRRYQGRICFETLCDIQATLPFKGAREIEEEAKLLLDRWATDDGYFILSDYGDGDAIGVPIEKKQIMLDAFRKHDRWRGKA